MKIKDLKYNWWLIVAAAIPVALLRIFMPLSFSECLEILEAIWDTGNRHARRAIRWMAAYPVILVVVALFGNLTVNALVALAIPLIAMAMLLRSSFDPLIVAAIAIFEEGRTVLKWLMLALGIETVVGLYFGLVPITNDYRLIPILILAVMALTFLSLSGKKLGFIKTILWILIIGTNVIFYFGGREAIKEKAEANYHPPDMNVPHVAHYAKKPARRFEYPQPGGGTIVRLETPCDREEWIATIPPHHKLELHHVYFGDMVKSNRCSYNVYGEAKPVYGPSGEETLEEFKNDLPSSKHIAHASLIKFIHPDMHTVYKSIRRNGDKIEAENCAGGEIRVYFIYNISKGVLFSELAQQIGHDGSTVTFEGTITPVKCSGI